MILAIIQARMGSTRLPGKVLQEVAGHPLLWHVVRRLERVPTISRVVIATTEQEADDRIARFCENETIGCFRGKENDLLDRYHQAARFFGADVVVRGWGHHPLLDRGHIEEALRVFLRGNVDYVGEPADSMGDPLRVEVFSATALERAWREARRPSEREDVTRYLRRSGRFRVSSLCDLVSATEVASRLVVELPRDLEFLRGVFSAFPTGSDFSAGDIHTLLQTRPELVPADARPERGKTLRELVASNEASASSGAGAPTLPWRRAEGARLWDTLDREFIDFAQTFQHNLLGYRNSAIEAVALAAKLGQDRKLREGISEQQLEARLKPLFPKSEAFAVAASASDAMQLARGAVRQTAGKWRIAFGGLWPAGTTQSPDPAINDWFESADVHPFDASRLADLDRLLQRHAGEFAAVALDAATFGEGDAERVAAIQSLAHSLKLPLLFDERRGGLDLLGGGLYGRTLVTPDLFCLTEGIGNGYRLAVVGGQTKLVEIVRRLAAELPDTARPEAFAAATKLLEIGPRSGALERARDQARAFQSGLNALLEATGLAGRIRAVGDPLLCRLFSEQPAFLARVLEEVNRCGVLVRDVHVFTSAHDETVVATALKAYAAAFRAVTLPRAS